jgi:hypothetical protein
MVTNINHTGITKANISGHGNTGIAKATASDAGNNAVKG